MGRKTFESLPGLLPNRTHLIITKDLNTISLDENTMYFNSILDAINYAYYNNEEELFIIGGGEIYKQCVNICNKIYLTIIDCNIKGDSYFKFNEDDFLLQTKEFIVKDDAGDDYDSQFFIYEKI
jgi:dihydrofolate reductase